MRAHWAGLSGALLLGGCNPFDVHSDDTIVILPTDAAADTDSLAYPTCPAVDTTETVLDAPDVRDLAVDDESIYWVTSSQVKARALSGGPTRTLAEAGGFRVLADRADVFWLGSWSAVGELTTLAAVPKPGGIVRKLLTTALGPTAFTREMVLDRTRVYASMTDGRILSVNKLGGGIADVVTGLSREFPTVGMDVAGNALFYGVPDAIRVRDLATRADGLVHSGRGIEGPVASDGVHVFSGSPNSSGLFLSTDRSTKTTRTLARAGYYDTFVRDRTHVYWNRGRDIGYTPLSGGSLTLLACGLNWWRLAQNSTHVFFLSGTQILRVKKPADAEPLEPCAATGASCAGGKSCCKGSCDPGSSLCSDCRATGVSCGAPADCCSGVCSSPTGTANTCSCYGAGTPCTEDRNCCGAKCLGGFCGGLTCSVGEQNCGGKCIPVLKDTKNCGGCGIVCSAGQNCCDGVCRSCVCNGSGFDGGSGASADCRPCCSSSCDSSKAPGATNWSSVCRK